MPTHYIHAAMWHAHYALLEDQNYYGEISDCNGVYASAMTLEECREQLQEVLEGWIVLGLRLGHSLPEPIIHNPHRGDISSALLNKLLQQAGIDRKEWERS